MPITWRLLALNYFSFGCKWLPVVSVSRDLVVKFWSVVLTNSYCCLETGPQLVFSVIFCNWHQKWSCFCLCVLIWVWSLFLFVVLSQRRKYSCFLMLFFCLWCCVTHRPRFPFCSSSRKVIIPKLPVQGCRALFILE